MWKFTPCGVSRSVKLRSALYFHKKTILLSLFAVLLYASGSAQVRTPEDKIDPAFRFAMAQPKPGERQVPHPDLKITPTKVLAAAGQPAEERYDCIVYTTDVATLRNNGVLVNSVLPQFVTAWATLQQIEQLSKLTSVNYIAAPVFDELHNDIAVASSGAALLHQGKLNNTVYKGKGVIVAIFDSGIDWRHPDFRDPDDTTKSRILRIWDQTISPIDGENSPVGMNYGVEYAQYQINDELDGTPTGYVRERDINGHGTHVAGTAVGNGAGIPVTRKYTGMAPEADIVVIKGGNGSFSTTNIINGMTYLKQLATDLGKPVVLNMSLGGQFGAHDGTRDYELAVDDFTASAPGRAVVISAGNDNGSNIHNQLSIAALDSATITFNVPAGTSGADVFDYRVYLNDNSDVTATFSAPGGGGSVTATAGLVTFAPVLGNGFFAVVRNVTEIGNGDRYIDVYIQRNGSNAVNPGGVWTLSLTNNTTNALSLHGWIYYKNALYGATTVAGGNNDYLVGSPGNASTAITVASYVGRPSWYTFGANGAFYSPTARMDDISPFSSHGPRRDGVLKPEIAAVGQHVISAFSSSSAAALPDIIYPGRYRKNQGTSMSAPVVTGALALLLQANPTASVSQLRTTLFNNTSTDSMTQVAGASPNTTWGYGRLDVYKAAGSVFNCSPVNRKTYQYDASNLVTQDVQVNLTTQRVAVRFTPDISGRLAGAYFHPFILKTALKMEVRADSAGIPGALLGTLNVPDTAIMAFTWNYVDLSDLDIPVTNSSDYHIVLYRDSISSATWSMRRENTSLDNRSLLSLDGASWISQAFDYKIRSVVYSNPQLTGNLVTKNSSTSRDIATTNLFIDSSCKLIAQVTPAGASAVSGTVTANVWKESRVPHDCGIPFVARHYQIVPAANADTATGRVTLYFTQAEFSAFNADLLSFLNLPANATDSLGKANLRIAKYKGTSGNGTGLPCSYDGDATLIDPADSDIVWNASASRWEVTFDVSGFGGFVVQTHRSFFPLVENLNGHSQGRANVLDWIFRCLRKWTMFEIETSSNGKDFSSIGRSRGWDGCRNAFNFRHETPQNGNNYYRIKVTDNGSVSYSNIILLQNESSTATTLYPSVIKKGESIQVVCAENEGVLRVMDATGRLVYSRVVTKGNQSITLPVTESGPYFYSIQNNRGKLTSGKLIIQ
ncbi:T9SS type A sorting domain-containing protein [Niastella caeni]|uniref:T9SS type A sorting domain-containing protein n=1 Tax=Niastella caeni TaxID=2569763 RepID=A0A4S8HS56_9BACT|nr:S8 family peptidase [Niastella caeni]THU38368.1 T9SS type A sorting domain-containing protein [Niastella caeni]